MLAAKSDAVTANAAEASWLQQSVVAKLNEQRALQKKLDDEAAAESAKLKAATWYNRTWHYMSDTSWGAALVVFVVVFIILCLARPRFVCSPSDTPYQRESLDAVRALVYATIATGLFLMLCYAFNCL